MIHMHVRRVRQIETADAEEESHCGKTEEHRAAINTYKTGKKH